MPCLHERFISSVFVNRLTYDDNGPVTSYSADIRIKCADCGIEFRFIGVSPGLNYSGPTCSADAVELRVPITDKKEPQFSNDTYGKKAKKEWRKTN